MEVILLESISGLGGLGDVVRIKDGYGRNYLLPRKKATRATKSNIELFEARRAELEAKAAETLAGAVQQAEKFNQLPPVIIEMQASEEGKLYGSVGTQTIQHALQQLNMKVEKKEILLPRGVFRETGEFDVNIQVHSDVIATVKIVIKAIK